MKEVMISTNFDAHTWRARIIPDFVVFFPLAVAVALWVPGLALIGRLPGMLLVPFEVSMLMSQIGRDMGKRREPRLWGRWGKPPPRSCCVTGTINPTLSSFRKVRVTCRQFTS
jgi:hypothetical protein